MTSITTNSSLLNITTTKRSMSFTKSNNDLVIGLTITGAFIVFVFCIICFLLHRYKRCPKCFKIKSDTTNSSPPSHPNPTTVKIHKEHTRDHSLPIPCPKEICKQYSINNLRLNREYFNFKYNRCYCHLCYPPGKSDHFTVAGSVYTVPRGWVRFGLQTDKVVAESKEIFQKWYTTFYGTSKDNLEMILKNRCIPFPGDRLLAGEIFTIHSSDKDHVYTSPSIDYASRKHICPTDTTKINDALYDVQVVLECKQNPEGIIKQKGYRSNVCRIIDNNEIVWKTNFRGSVVPYGLLIRVCKHR